jgi:hypothetical protein
MLKFFLAVMLVLTAFAVQAEGTTWYELDDNETHVADFVLKSGEKKSLQIDSSRPLKTGFKADVPGFDMYEELRERYGWDVIKLRDVNTDASLSTISGGSMTFQPKDGRIMVEAENLTDRAFNVLVYVEKDGEALPQPSAGASAIERSYAEGEVRFLKNDFIETDGVTLRQPIPFVKAVVQGHELEMSLQMFMSMECFNEELFANTPGIVIGYTASHPAKEAARYFGFDISFYDGENNLLGRAVSVDNKVDPDYALVSSVEKNLSADMIERIRRYRIVLLESAGPLPADMLPER